MAVCVEGKAPQAFTAHTALVCAGSLLNVHFNFH